MSSLRIGISDIVPCPGCEYAEASCDDIRSPNTINEEQYAEKISLMQYPENNNLEKVKMLSEVQKSSPDNLQNITGLTTLLNLSDLSENQCFSLGSFNLTGLSTDERNVSPKNCENIITEKRETQHMPNNMLSGLDSDPYNFASDLYDTNFRTSFTSKARRSLDFTEHRVGIQDPQENNIHNPEIQKKSRSWDRRNACVYCDQLVTNFSRHLLRNHSNEHEVLQYMSINDSDAQIRKKKRQKITDELRNRGNFKHNSAVAFDKNGILLPRKRNKQIQSPSNYVNCKNCLGTYKRASFYRHFKKCFDYKSNTNQHSLQGAIQNRVLKRNAISIIPNLFAASEELTTNIIPRLRNDEISLIVQTDPLILAFGSRLLKKKKEMRSRKAICSRMRDLATLLKTVREKDATIKTLEDILDPTKYETFIMAVKTMCGFNDETGFVDIISLPARIRPAILGCIDILYTKMIMSHDHSTAYKEAYKKRSDDFKFLLEINWQWEISSNADKTRKRLHMTKETVLPLEEDIEKVTKKIYELEETVSKKLKKDVNVIFYEQLCEVTIAHIILLDRKRAGDVAEAELTFYINRKSEEVPEKILQSLTDKQKKCIEDLEIFQIPGKRTRAVPILLTKNMRANIDLIISCRPVLKIPSSNPYLFARPMTSAPFDGGKCLDKIKKMCVLKKPQMLTSTGMRHHVATMSQIEANHNDVYTEHLAGFLGHDMAVHSKNYRLPLQVLQKAVVGSKLIEYENEFNHKNYGKRASEKSATITSKDFENPEKGINDNASEPKTDETTQILEFKIDLEEIEPETSNENKSEIVEIKNVVHYKKALRKRKQNNLKEQDISTEEEKCPFDDVETDVSDFELEKKNENLSSAASEDEQEDNTKAKRRKIAHTKWTNEEIKLVQKHFKENIEKKRNPGKAKCETVLQKEPILRNRTWMQLNTYVNNIYKKKSIKKHN